jgi:hypothetical protein
VPDDLSHITGVATALTQQFNAVQADIAAHNTAKALADLHSFASHITVATANTLLTDAQLVYAGLARIGSV